MACKKLPSAACMLLILICIMMPQDVLPSDYEGKAIGVYLYENIEGYHTVSSTAGTVLSNDLLTLFGKVTSVDKVPLESNETVRILEGMTEDRKVVITALNTWIAGNVISAPSITFADDAIKFKDLTWHVDDNAVREDAKKKNLDYILTGAFSGMVKQASSGNGKLKSVTVIANMRIMDLNGDAIVWSGSFSETAAGFDPRVAFNDAVMNLCKKAGKEINTVLGD